MNREDVMIGDWVYNSLHKPVRVDAAPYNYNMKKVNFAYHDIEECTPIPLTSDILEKNGFPLNREETDSTIQYMYRHYTEFFNFPLGRGFYIEYDTVENVFWITDHAFIKFKCVHEFQHVLKLCGIKKDIVLCEE